MIVIRVRRAFMVLAALVSVLFAGGAAATPASGYWWNTAQPTRGYVIEIQGNTMFMAGFLYSSSGEATWVASSGAMTSATQYSGPLITYTGGQTLTGAFKAATLSTTPSLGTIAISFTSDTAGTITITGNGSPIVIPIVRFDFGPGGSGGTQPATNPQTGWWWNPNEGGRGFAIEVQGGFMYFAGYMYDTSGNPTWYLAYGNVTDSALYAGQWAQFGNGQTLTGPFKAATVANANVGSATLQFSSTSSATLTLPDGRQIPLTRYNFGVAGPTLAAFSSATSAPASLLGITGSNINPSATLSLTFSDSTGFSVNVPLAAASVSGVSVSVPPYYNVATGVFGSAAVNVKLTQTVNGQSADSNTLTGFTIQKLPAAPAGTAGQSTLSLIRANLSAAQKLQTSIKGTAQDSAAAEASIAAQITDLNTLLLNVQKVVQNGTSFSLGTVGGVNITVTSSNISDVDNLILANLQALAAAPPGTLANDSGGRKGAELAPALGCMAAEAQAFAQAVAAGTTGAALDALALALVNAPSTSPACGTVNAFTLAYEIFGGSGAIGLGIANAAGNSAVASKLPGAALFSTTNANASIAIALNALLSQALSGNTASVQNAVAAVTALSQPATAELIANATGILLAALTDSQAFVNIVAPPPSAGVPTNLPTGMYTLTLTYNYSIQGQVISGGPEVIPLTNTDAALFASEIQSEINAFNASGCSGGGTICSAVVTPFNGTTLQFVFTISGPGVSGNFTYILTKTG